MPLRLTEKSRAKTAMGLARADNLLNDIVIGMIEELSEMVQDECFREFEKRERTDFITSYDQYPSDPVPQFLKVKAWPIDPDAALTVTYSPNDDHDNAAYTLVLNTDYSVDYDSGTIIIKASPQLGFRTLPQLAGLAYAYAPRGFKVTYTGGYAVNDTVSSPPDPLDDDGMIMVPLGLRSFIASKIGADYIAKKQIQQFKPEEIQALYPYRR